MIWESLVLLLADTEGLTAHAKSVRVRLEKKVSKYKDWFTEDDDDIFLEVQSQSF